MTVIGHVDIFVRNEGPQCPEFSCCSHCWRRYPPLQWLRIRARISAAALTLSKKPAPGTSRGIAAN
jgi:hypothetical protein